MLMIASVSYSQVNSSKAPFQITNSLANQLSFSPATQNITLDSGETGNALVQISVTGNDPDPVFTSISIVSLDDAGFQSFDPGDTTLDAGQITTATFTFNQNVSTTTTSTYVFKLEWEHDGVSNDGEITVNVTYEVGGGDDGDSDSCNPLPPYPNKLHVTFNGISPSNSGYRRFTLSREFATNSNSNQWSYQIRLREFPDQWSEPSIVNGDTRTGTVINSNTRYDWRASNCPEGGNWSPIQTFKTVGVCPTTNLATSDVHENSCDTRTGSNYLEARNSINDMASAHYSSGQLVVLKPGFTANIGSFFRAYIEDCSTYTTSRTNEISNENVVIPKKNHIIIYPNPTRSQFSVENKDLKIINWEIYDQYGTSQLKNRAVLGKTIKVDLSNKRTGIYFMRLTLTSGEVVSKSIIKK